MRKKEIDEQRRETRVTKHEDLHSLTSSRTWFAKTCFVAATTYSVTESVSGAGADVLKSGPRPASRPGTCARRSAAAKGYVS